MDRKALIVGASLVLPLAARADVIVMRGGGRVQGKVVADPASKEGDRILVVLPRGKTPLSLRKEQVLQVLPEPGPLDEYAVRRAKLEATARSDYELGLWCEENDLPDLARLHFEAALKRDPDLAEARAKLDATTKRLPRVSLREDEPASDRDDASAWPRRIRILLQGLVSESADRRRDAERELEELRDPEAVGPLVKILGGREADVRIVLARALGAIPGETATRALVDMILREAEDVVRGPILDELRRRPGTQAVSRLIRALRSSDVAVINRAAWALGRLEAHAAVPRLLDVLVTSEERVVLVPTGGPAYGDGLGPLIAYNGSSAAYMTGPVVGPGVVAYGATVVPDTIGLDPFNGGAPISVGDGMGPRFVGADKGPQPQVMTFTTQNVEVRSALNLLTGQDFEYNVPAWRAWVSRSFNPKPVPDRKAPQP